MVIALGWAGNFTAMLGTVMLIVAIFSEWGGDKSHR